MKRLLICLPLILSTPAFGANFILNYYDDTFYPEGDVATAGIGELVGISDIYYSWNLLNGTLTSTQTEWIADGMGGMVSAPYESRFSYKGLTLENLDSFLPYSDWTGAAESFRNQLSDLREATSSKFDVINALSINNSINSSVQERLKTSSGSFWFRTVYSNLNEFGQSGMSSNSFGFVFGADKNIGQSVKLGAGFYIDGADFDVDDSSKDVTNYSGFLYSQYRKDAFYINGVLNYVLSNYKELNMENKIDAYNANLHVGYNITDSLVAEFGVKYTHLNPYEYKYGENYYTKTAKSDYVTLNPGVQYSKQLGIFNLSANVGGMYLAYNDIGDQEEYLFDIYKLQTIRIEDKNKFGFSAGVNFGVNLGFVYANLGYDYVRSIYYSDNSVKLSLRSMF